MLSAVIQYGDFDDFRAELRLYEPEEVDPVRSERWMKRSSRNHIQAGVTLAFIAGDFLHLLTFLVGDLNIPDELVHEIQSPGDFERLGKDADRRVVVTRLEQVHKYLEGLIRELGVTVARGRIETGIDFTVMTGGWENIPEEAKWIAAPIG